jgi:hypothetical protein
MNQSDRYFEETLFQAKRHALPIHYIKQLESQRMERIPNGIEKDLKRY